MSTNTHEGIVIGSRESALAMVQSRMVESYIKEHAPNVKVSILPMKTTGDKILDRKLEDIGGKGLFVKELDLALKDGRSDLSVHSLKDLPMEVDPTLPVICFSKREDPRDALVLPEGVSVEEFMNSDFTKPIGTSSKRRILQLKKLFPKATFESVRGNLQTRLRKLDEGQYSAIILAAAGLKRMGLGHRISKYFEVEEIIPAAGQGILAIQGKEGMDYSFLAGFEDERGEAAALAERAFVTALDGGCTSPIAAHLRFEGEEAILQGFYCDEEIDQTVTGQVRMKVDPQGNFSADDFDLFEDLGVKLAEDLLRELKQ